ncbi:hypothetical protein TorRG33x02_083710 [Trema orientale]|uniref:Uncharacterized protein n=1 Tax=Trema orientale TaxID=63057 RepID=A0A2P5FDJ1_TREOI|nr:hypothetical protein TorRG33x02_083710 [Trema orientale]
MSNREHKNSDLYSHDMCTVVPLSLTSIAFTHFIKDSSSSLSVPQPLQVQRKSRDIILDIDLRKPIDEDEDEVP